MVYKQVSLGMKASHSGARKVYWFHDKCALRLEVVAGNSPEKTDEKPPEDAKCYVCGKLISSVLTEISATPDHYQPKSKPPT